MKKDRNGYMPSIMDTTDGECFVCKHNAQTVRHEIFYGTANRQISKTEGTWINVCPFCHNNIHANPTGFRDLKRMAQERWIKVNNTTEEAFIQLFGKLWL